MFIAFACGAAIVATVFLLSRGDDVASTTTLPPAAGGTSLAPPTGTDDGSSTEPAVEVVFPESRGRFHEWVSIGGGELVMFGGLISLGDSGTAPFEGTWRFDTATGTWSVETPAVAPSPRFGHAMAYHPPTGRVVVFGGGTTSPRGCPRIRFCPGPEDDELWQYDPATGIWESMKPASTEGVDWPIPRFGMRMVYEPVTERLVLFGGVGVFGDALTPNFWNDTWAYDPATNVWEELSDPDEALRPQGAVQYGMVWNEETQRVLMFGGDGIPDDPQNLYAFDPSTGAWEDLGVAEPGEGPKDRWFHSMVSDPQSGRAVVIGGNGSIYRIISGGTIRTNGDLDEVWTWSAAEGWILMEALAGDVIGAAAAPDELTKMIVVYGGGDVWSYDGAADTWRVVWERPGDA